VGRHAPPAAEPPAGRRQDRLVAGRGGQRQRARRRGGELTGPNPTDPRGRGKPGSKHHLIVDANGIPLAAIITAANVNDVTQLLPLVDSIPPIAGLPGAPRRRPDTVQGDAGYRSGPHRVNLWARGIEPIISELPGVHGSGLGVTRWVVERTLSWLHQFRRLRIRFDRRADIHQAFLTLGCALICHRCLVGSLC
jgi:transposase